MPRHPACGLRAVAAAVLAAVLSVAGAGPAAAAGGGQPGPIGVGLMAVQSAGEIRALWQPVLNAVGRRIGADVHAEISRDYAGIVWAMRSGRVQIAWLGNKSAIEAVDHADGEVFMQTLYASGEGGYRSLLLVGAGSPYGSAEAVLADAARLTLGTGDTNSTSGYLVPGAYLFGPARTTPRAAFRRVVQANHEDNLLAVAEGRVDAATIASLVYDRIAQTQPELVGRVRVVWQSPLIPADALVWRRDLPDALKRAIRDAFLDFGAARADKPAGELAAERAAMDRLGFSRFAPSDNGQLVPVRRIELYRNRLRAAEDAGLTPEERQRRLAEIDRHLAAFGGPPAAVPE